MGISAQSWAQTLMQGCYAKWRGYLRVDRGQKADAAIASSQIVARIRARFGFACRIADGRHRHERDTLSITYDTPWLPHTWEAFVAYDEQMSAAIAQFVVLELCPAQRIFVRHAARAQRIVLLPSGTDGVVAVPQAPEYFRRTGQDSLFHRDRHTSETFKL